MVVGILVSENINDLVDMFDEACVFGKLSAPGFYYQMAARQYPAFFN